MEKYIFKDQKFINHLERLSRCEACSIRFTGQHKCPGLGNLDAEVMFIGEAPGEVENPDLRELPFVGNRSSDLIMDIIYGLWPHGYDDVFITNIVKCNPPQNRTPTEKEVRLCSCWLREELKIVQPKVIVALGRTAANFFGIEESLNNARFKDYLWEGKILFVLPHPAYALRNGPRAVEQYKQLFKRVKRCLEVKQN